MARAPLPKFFGTHSIAKDWKTGETEQHMVFRRGRWWDESKWLRDSDGRDRERDMERMRKYLRLRAYLSSQPINPI